MTNISLRPGSPTLLLVAALFLMAPIPALSQLCFGYEVKGSMETLENLQAQLDTADDTTNLNFSVSFWWPGHEVEDTLCFQDPDCPEPESTSVGPATELWTAWIEDLFGKYTIRSAYDWPDSILTGKESSVTDHRNGLRAPKSTILAIREECYIARMGASEKPILAGTKKAPANPRSSSRNPASFNAAGRKQVQSSKITPSILYRIP